MAEHIFDAQVNYGWGLSLNMTGKAPAIAKRIFLTYQDAFDYVNDKNDSAIQGLQLSVIQDKDEKKNGIYFVAEITTNGKQAKLVKVGEGNGTVLVDTYNEAKKLATTETIGQIVYLKTEDSSSEPGQTYTSGPYIITGEGTLSKIGTTTASGDLTSDIEKLNTQVGNIIKASGLKTDDGTYTASTSSKYISGATSLSDADIKLNNAIVQNTITGATGLNITTGTSGTTLSLKINESDKILSVDNTGLTATLSLSYSSSDKKIYLYGKESGTTSDAISSIDATDFVKDGMLSSVEVVELSGGTSGNPDRLEDGKYLKFDFNTDSGIKDTYININDLAKVYTAGNGLSLSNNQFSVKLDPSSESKYLAVSESGLKLTGISAIQTDVDSKISTLTINDVAMNTSNTTLTLDTSNIKVDKSYTGSLITSGMTLSSAFKAIDDKISQASTYSEGNGISITGSGTEKQIAIKLDSVKENNILELSQNGIYLSNNWDCGTFVVE